jgi:pyrroline-5-carboxylate reductase
MPLSQKIGFIGTGAITDALVRGLLAEPAAVVEIMVSQRSVEISAKLAADFPAVFVADDNQAIVDSCNTVVLAIRSQFVEEVIPPSRSATARR